MEAGEFEFTKQLTSYQLQHAYPVGGEFRKCCEFLRFFGFYTF